MTDRTFQRVFWACIVILGCLCFYAGLSVGRAVFP